MFIVCREVCSNLNHPVDAHRNWIFSYENKCLVTVCAVYVYTIMSNEVNNVFVVYYDGVYIFCLFLRV